MGGVSILDIPPEKRRTIIYENRLEECAISKITVIDSIMGSGKTNWSIQHINRNIFDNFLYITPFLDEVNRIIKKSNRDFKQPINKGNGKLDSINELLVCQSDIASTHELFKHLNEESRANIKEGHYTLILDEVLNVIEPYDNIRNDDMKLLKESGCVTVDDDGFVIWNKEKMDYDTKYNEIKILADNRSLIYINQKLLLWRYPPEIFTLFDKIYILTYLFESSILKNYFDLYQIEYEQKSISEQDGEYHITDFFVPDTSIYIEKINIYDGKLNENIYQKINGLSVTWFRAKINQDNIKQIKRNLYNYFSNILSAKAETIMWTTFKDYRNRLKGKGYSNQFVSYNCRSTNDYDDRFNLAYCVNVYLHPGITQFFKQRGINIDEDLYGLSEMIQWIWRSRVRKGENINIYIPSMRMRNLLNAWMKMNLEYQNRIAS